jgi:hypothetical protein
MSFAERQRFCLVGPGMPSDGLIVGDQTLYLNEFRTEFYTCPTCHNVEHGGEAFRLVFLDAPSHLDVHNCANCRDGGSRDSRRGMPSDIQLARTHPEGWKWSQVSLVNFMICCCVSSCCCSCCNYTHIHTHTYNRC